MVEINFSLLIPYISVFTLIKKHWRIVCFFEMQENRQENAAILNNIYNYSNYFAKKIYICLFSQFLFIFIF